MNKKYNQRGEFFENLANEVRKLPVLLVIGTLIPVYRGNSPMMQDELDTAVGNFKALCPFHADNKLGSFVITQMPGKNMWYCFTDSFRYCNWSVIDFEERYFDFWNPEWDDSEKEDFADEKLKAFKLAVFHLARRFDLITEEEYERYSSKKIESAVIRHVQKTVEESKKKMVQVKKADQDVIDTAYICMARVCRLSENHLKHLRRERHLAETDLDDYFTFPTRNMDLARKIYQEAALLIAQKKYGSETRKIKSLKSLNESELAWLKAHSGLKRLEEQLPYVPGFFYDLRKDRIDFASYTGIGFLVKDDNGHVNGIQIRRDKVKEGEMRYVWFSSAFAQAKEEYAGGVSCGSPGGFIRSKRNNAKPYLCITEGRFKAEAIAKQGNDAVYVSGVGTWKSVVSMIDRVKGNRDRVLIMFDADMMGNTAVHSQLRDLANEMCSHGLSPYLVVWPKDRGKGFDDLVIGSGETYFKKMKYVPFDQFEQVYQKVLADTLALFGAKHVKDIHEKIEFSITMQSSVEEAIGFDR